MQRDLALCCAPRSPGHSACALVLPLGDPPGRGMQTMSLVPLLAAAGSRGGQGGDMCLLCG